MFEVELPCIRTVGVRGWGGQGSVNAKTKETKATVLEQPYLYVLVCSLGLSASQLGSALEPG